jgi:hypothetical protein
MIIPWAPQIVLDQEDDFGVYSRAPQRRRAMTTLLEKAFEAASKLPASEQDALAASILAEVEAERRWDTLFEGSMPILDRLAEEALAEHQAKKTLPFAPKGA